MRLGDELLAIVGLRVRQSFNSRVMNSASSIVT
jgi:hypothetical protein